MIAAAVTMLVNSALARNPIWVQISVLITGSIELYIREWVASEKLGKIAVPSALLKLGLALIGTYATLGQFVCIAPIFWWLVA